MQSLDRIVADFASCLARVDAARPVALNSRSKEPFLPGIGPHTEAAAVRLIADDLKVFDPSRYEGCIAVSVPYPELPRQRCDLCLGRSPDWEWAVEVKMLRFIGDNGKPNDNILMHILSPYVAHRSAVTDCSKLVSSSLGQCKAILIYGFESTDWPLEPAISAFELVASTNATLGKRHYASFDGLVHPVHQRGAVFAWEVAQCS